MKTHHPLCGLCAALCFFSLCCFSALLACSEGGALCPPHRVQQGDNCVPLENDAEKPLWQWCGENHASLESDSQHCGACNQACAQTQYCANGQCHMCNGESRVYAACFLTGHVAVLSSETQSRVALERVGANPQALSGMGEVLLCADDQARLLWRLNAQTLKEVGEAVSIGAIPIHVATSGSQIYVTNAASSTLQVIDSRTWQTRAELNFGRNTYPQAFVRVGEYGFVPLYGNLFADTQPGQRLVRLNLSNPDALVREGEADFSNLDLHSYAGITSPRPMPYDVLHHQGALYVALNNLDEETCAAGYCVPAGPGLVAKVDPYTLHTSTLLLGDECLNAVSLTSNGKLLVASCAGSWRQGEEGRGSGLALMEGDEVKSRWVAPSGFYPGVMASKCDELWVANANGGDVYLFSTEGGRLRLLRGTDSSGASGSEGGPMATCPLVLRGKAEVATVQSLWLKP